MREIGTNPEILRPEPAEAEPDQAPIAPAEADFAPESKAAPERDGHRERLEQMREEFFAFLEQEGILSYAENGIVAVDVDTLARELSNKLAGNYQFSKYRDLGANHRYTMLQRCFEGVPVVSKIDWEASQREDKPAAPKPLFYEPESRGTAFLPEKIKATDFYLSPLSFSGIKLKNHEQLTTDGEGADLQESAIALLIYHPDYGNGYRDNSGRLMVWWPSRKEFRPISIDWVRGEMGKDFGNPEVASLATKPAKFINSTQELEKRGLLKPDDFRQLKISAESAQFRVRSKVGGSSGFAFLDGVRYYIGKGERFQDAEAVILSPGIGGVIGRDRLSGRKKLISVFDTIDRNAPGLKVAVARAGAKPIPGATKGQTNLRPFDAEELYPQHTDENPDAHARRVRAMEDTDYLMRFSDRVSAEAGVNLAHLDLAEQGVIVDAVKSVKDRPGRVIGLARDYGQDGLRAFASGEYGGEYGDRVLAIGEKLKKNQAQEFFHEYAVIMEKVKLVAGEFSDIFGEERFMYEFQEAITRRMKDIINTTYQLAQSGQAEASFYGRQIETKNPDEPIEALRNVRHMTEVVGKFLSGQESEQQLFKFLAPVLDESVVAHTPEGVSHEKGLWTCYRFAVEPMPGVNDKPSQLMVQLRKYGAPVRNGTSLHNKEIEFDGEARINFVWIPDPEDPEGVYLNTNAPERVRAISFRLDREGKVRDQAGNLVPEKNDPTRAQGELSLEMGAVPFSDEPALNDNTVIGKTIAIGQYYSSQHDAREHGQRPQYYHNRASFSPQYGQADFFATLVEKMARSIEERYVQEAQIEAAAA